MENEPDLETSNTSSKSSSVSSTSSTDSAEAEVYLVPQLLFKLERLNDFLLFGNGFYHVFSIQNGCLVQNKKESIELKSTNVFGVGYPALRLDGAAYGIYERSVWDLNSCGLVCKLRYRVGPFCATVYGDRIVFLADGVFYYLDLQLHKSFKCSFQPSKRYYNSSVFSAHDGRLVFIPSFGNFVGILRGAAFEEKEVLPGFSVQVVNLIRDDVVLKVDHQETALLNLETLSLRRAGRLVPELEWSYCVGDNVIFGDNATENLGSLLMYFQ